MPPPPPAAWTLSTAAEGAAHVLSRVAKDPRARDPQGRVTRFLVVHGVLIGLALALAAASVSAGVAALLA